MNIRNKFVTSIASLLLVLQPVAHVFAQDVQRNSGKLEVRDCCVTVVNPDGSVLNLDVGAKYALFIGMLVITDETGVVNFKVPDGRYVEFENSTVEVVSIGDGDTGLRVPGDKMAKVCYCFSEKGDYLVDASPADLKDYEGPQAAAATAGQGYIREQSLGITAYSPEDGIFYAAQWRGTSQFDSEALPAGEAACKPSCDNPRDDLGGFVDCCSPDLVPLWITSAFVAAAVGGAIVGATTISDPEGSEIMPPPQ